MPSSDISTRYVFSSGMDHPTEGYLRADRPIQKYRQNLPHWRQQGAMYFVTFRLADSIPAEKLEMWNEQRRLWCELHPAPWDATTESEYMHYFSGQIERWLDAGAGSCVLRQLDCQRIVADVLKARDAIEYVLDAWTIMPNHVHVVCTPVKPAELSKIVQAWKSVSANRINRLLHRSGSLWQKEYFDHIPRDPQRLAKIRCYISGQGTGAM